MPTFDERNCFIEIIWVKPTVDISILEYIQITKHDERNHDFLNIRMLKDPQISLQIVLIHYVFPIIYLWNKQSDC